MSKQTDYVQYAFNQSSIDLVDLYAPDKEKVLWLYYPKKADTCNQTINYLIAKHHIDYGIVKEFIDADKLWQTKPNNTMEFPITTERNDLVAVEAIKWDNTGVFKTKESYGYGFTYQVGSAINWLIFVKSAIELMCLYQLKKSALVQIGCLLVSMGGSCPTVIARYKSLYPHTPWCVAFNEKAGDAKNITNHFTNVKWRSPDEPYKKWQDMLWDKTKALYEFNLK